MNYLLFIEENRNRKQTWDSIKRAEETKSSSIAPLTMGGGSSDVDDVEKAEKSSFPATFRSTRFPGWFISTSGKATYMVPAIRCIWILFELSATLHKLHESDHKGVDIMSEACNSLVSNWHSSMTTCVVCVVKLGLFNERMSRKISKKPPYSFLGNYFCRFLILACLMSRLS